MGNATAPASHPHHPQGIRLQPLPACLAPDDAARREHPELSLPRPGDTVVIDGGMIHFLQIIDPAQPVSAANSILWAAGMRGYDQCNGADWHDDLSPLDDEFPGLEVGAPQRIRARRDVLIEHCAAADTPFAHRADVRALRAALARHGLTMTIEPQGVGVDLPIVPVSDGTHITIGPIEDYWPEDGEPPITGWAADHCDDRNIYPDHIAHVHEDQPDSTGDPEPAARAIAAYLATYAPATGE